MNAIDDRIVRLSIEVQGVLRTYEGMDIVATGTKYANANQNDCEIRISNLAKDTRDFLLTELSPFNPNRSPKTVILEAGRKSYGVTKIYEGNVVTAVASQPPDIAITLKSLTANHAKGDIIARGQPGQASLKVLSEQVAADLGLSLDFQAEDKQVGNYNFTGAALKQVDRLGDTGRVNAYVDDGKLVVKPFGQALANQIRDLDMDSGLIGIPEITEKGIKATYFLDTTSVLGGGLRVTSTINPAVNGTYTIYQLGFNIASRDVPFYYVAEASRDV